MTRSLASSLFAVTSGVAVLTRPAAVYAIAPCPTTAAVSKAVGYKVTQPNPEDCVFRVGERRLTIQFTVSKNVGADLTARRADAVRRTAPVKDTKVGSYKAFTGTASSVAQIFYDQNGMVVYVSHQEINAQSADILKRSATALSKITVPAKISSCTAISKAVVGAVAGAKFVAGGDGSCQFTLADGSTVFVGIQSDESYADWKTTYELTTQRPPVADIKVGTRRGFAFVTFGTDVVLALDDSIATISLDARENGPLSGSLPVKAAAALP